MSNNEKTPDISGILDAAGVEKSFSTKEVAEFFGKSDQWVYWVMRQGLKRQDGTEIEPERVGASRRRRFTLPNIEDIAIALYQRGTLAEDGLREVLTKLAESKRS